MCVNKDIYNTGLFFCLHFTCCYSTLLILRCAIAKQQLVQCGQAVLGIGEKINNIIINVSVEKLDIAVLEANPSQLNFASGILKNSVTSIVILKIVL